MELYRADATNLDACRVALGLAARGEAVLVASYDRSAMGQTGSGRLASTETRHVALAAELRNVRAQLAALWTHARQNPDSIIPSM